MYLINNILYNYRLKKIPILDVLSISFGFIFRTMSGIYVVNDIPTTWVILCTMFLALFLGFSKRRAELGAVSSSDNDFNQRPVLKKYNQNILDSLVNETSLGAIITYALFTTTSGKNPALITTLPIVFFAINHYKMSIFQNIYGEEPEIVFVSDKVIWISIILWLLLYTFIMKLNPIIFVI